MIDLNYQKKHEEYEPNWVEITALVIVTIVWMYIILGSMGAF